MLPTTSVIFLAISIILIEIVLLVVGTELKSPTPIVAVALTPSCVTVALPI